jgi:hypothetical protein
MPHCLPRKGLRVRTLLLVVSLLLAIPVAGSPLPEECPTERPPTAVELGQLPWLAEHPFGAVIAVPTPSAVWSGHLVRLARGERLTIVVDTQACVGLSLHQREGTGWGAPLATGAGRRAPDGTVRVLLETDVTRAGTYLVVVGSPSGHAVPRAVHVSCTRGACRGYTRCRPLDNRYEPLQVGALLRKRPEAPPFLVRLEGTVRAASTVTCTKQVCDAEDDCCQSCTQGLGFRNASGFLSLSPLRCDGDNCNPGRRCDLPPGSRAVVWGMAPADRDEAFEVAGACSQRQPQAPLP